MRNHPAFRRLMTYIKERELTPAQVAHATNVQLAKVMWPPDGKMPPKDWATPKLARRCLRGMWRERRIEATQRQLRKTLEKAGIGLREVVELGEHEYELYLREPG